MALYESVALYDPESVALYDAESVALYDAESVEETEAVENEPVVVAAPSKISS